MRYWPISSLTSGFNRSIFTLPVADMEDDLIRTVAESIMVYPYKVWGYGEGIALEALLLAGDTQDEPGYLSFVQDLILDWIHTGEKVSYEDHVAPGTALLMLYERAGHPNLLDRAYELAALIAALPKTVPGARIHRPDHPEYRHYVYVDCMDFDAPFLCWLARATGERVFDDLAVDCLLGHAHTLFDNRRGLFSHVYDAASGECNRVFWGRGNGWAALGMMAALELLPMDHPDYAEIAGLFRQQMASVVELQSESGDWHTVLDQPDTYMEGSLCAMFYCVLVRGIRAGLLPAGYSHHARGAWSALRSRLRQYGLLSGVSAATPPGNMWNYAAIPTGEDYPWGQGPLLEALLLGPPAQG